MSDRTVKQLEDNSYMYEGTQEVIANPIPSDIVNIFVDYDLGAILGGTFTDDPELIKQEMEHVTKENLANGVGVNLVLFRRVDYKLT